MAIPTTMKALILKQDGFSNERTGIDIDTLEPWLDYGDLPVPSPKPGEILVKVIMSSVNPSDLYFIKGEYGQKRVKGAAAGFEGVGEVVAGNGLYAKFLVGKRVAFAGGGGGSGAWAEYITVKAAMAVPVMKGVRDEDAAGLIVNPLTAMAMFNAARKAGAKAFVFTAANSQLGKYTMSLARDYGLKAIATVRKDSQIAHLKELGATHVLNCTADDFESELAKVMKAEKPTFMIDAVADETSATIFTAMANKTRWMIYGRLGTDAPRIHEPGQFIFMMKQIEGFWLVKWFAETPLLSKLATIRAVQKRFASGAWKTEVGETVKLSDAMEKLPAALSNAKGKVLISI